MDTENLWHPDGPGANALGSEPPEAPGTSVAELLERRILLTWPEAVAIVAQACHLATSNAPAAALVPEPSRLLIFADGSMRAGPGRGAIDLPATARLLLELSANTDLPAPLRALVGEAITADKFWLVAEFADALADYERPGRARLIQAVFERFRVSRPPAGASVSASGSIAAAVPAPIPPVEPTAAPVRNPVQQLRAQLPDRAKRIDTRALVAPVSLVAGAGVLVAGLWVYMAGQVSPELPVLPNAGLRAAGDTSNPGADWIEPLLLPLALQGFDRSIAPESSRRAALVRPARPATAAAPGSSSGVSGPAPGASVPPGPAAPDPAPPVAARASTNPSPAGSPAQFAPVSPPAAPAPSAGVASREDPRRLPRPSGTAAIAEADERVYGSESPDVKPPVPLDARALPSNTPGNGAQAQNQMELLIAANGRVEAVRMVSRPARMSDMMMLSGAKNWLFNPATKDGKPVRYRLPITWTVSQ